MEVIKEKRALEKHSCHLFFKLQGLIFICNEWLKVYMQIFYPANFCFSELRKCLLKNFYK